MKFRVLSYNTHRAIGIDRRFRLERVADIIAHHNPDICLLQEMDKGVPRSRKLDLAKVLAEKLDYPHYVAGYNVRLMKGHYGNATLSRFPIVAERNIDLTEGLRKCRGCQYTRIHFKNGNGFEKEMDVFNLHLGLSGAERMKQVGMLAQSSEYRAAGLKDPLMIGGDFNDWRSVLAPIFVEVLGLRCATNRRAGYTNPIKTYPSFSPTGGLDRIFYRGDLCKVAAKRCNLGVSKVASDHLPIIVDFEFVE